MFYNHWLSCKVHHNINNWNISNVQDMSYMFGRAVVTHPLLDKWNVSNVTTMAFMFHRHHDYNHPLNTLLLMMGLIEQDTIKVCIGYFYHKLIKYQPLKLFTNPPTAHQ